MHEMEFNIISNKGIKLLHNHQVDKNCVIPAMLRVGMPNSTAVKLLAVMQISVSHFGKRVKRLFIKPKRHAFCDPANPFLSMCSREKLAPMYVVICTGMFTATLFVIA